MPTWKKNNTSNFEPTANCCHDWKKFWLHEEESRLFNIIIHFVWGCIGKTSDYDNENLFHLVVQLIVIFCKQEFDVKMWAKSVWVGERSFSANIHFQCWRVGSYSKYNQYLYYLREKYNILTLFLSLCTAYTHLLSTKQHLTFVLRHFRSCCFH